MRKFEVNRKSSNRSAFTLLEVIIVIGIIVFLTGLTVTMTASAVRASEVRSTKQTLELLDLAVSEWEVEAGRKLSWETEYDAWLPHAPGYVADVHATTPEILIISEILNAVEQVPASKNVLAQIDTDVIYRYKSGERASWISPPEQFIVDSEFAGSLTVLDAWGFPIYATHPGRLFDRNNIYEQGEPDEDGTIRTYNEDKYGVARNRRVCFVSAGPDNDFGYVHGPHNSHELEATYDNLWSYAPLINAEPGVQNPPQRP